VDEGLPRKTRRAGDRSWRFWGVRLAAALLLAAAIAFLPHHLFGGTDGATLEGVDSELGRVRAEIAARRVDNAELRRDIEALRSDPGAIEDIARRELGMVRPGEVILRFEEAHRHGPACGPDSQCSPFDPVSGSRGDRPVGEAR
jgi:cell division protein FtsB